ncbi:MAG: hypothetical protein AABM43_08865, partial [Actinomycetota bacterium]
GGYLIADFANHRIRKVSATGIISTVAGTTSGFSGDGGPATAAQLNTPLGVAPTADGGYLIADFANHRIRKVSAAGIISTVAGTTSFGLSGDGGPATAAQLNNPQGVAPTADGGFLIADRGNSRIRKVSAAGIISTVAGTTAGFSGDGGPATAAQLNDPSGVAPTADGGFLIADLSNHRIRQVSAAGIINTVAGTTSFGLSGDGGPATAAQLNGPIGVAPTPDGGFLIADFSNSRVRKVSAAGIISTVAGTTEGLSGDGGPATAAQLDHPAGVAPAPDGGFLIADQGNHRIRRVEGKPAPAECGPGPFFVILGTAGADVLAGTVLRDAVLGGEGNDTLSGAEGADCLLGEGGNDRLSGDSEGDLLLGGKGKDKANGGKGNDRAQGGVGNDKLGGGSGKDRLTGGKGRDKLTGGKGRDKLTGGKGKDRLVGGRGRDTLNCGAGKNDVAIADRKDRVKPSCEKVK